MSGIGSDRRVRAAKLASFLFALTAALCLWATSASAAIILTEEVNKVSTPRFELDFGDNAFNVERVDSIRWTSPTGSTLGENLARQGGGAGAPCTGPTEFWGQSYTAADSVLPYPVVTGNVGPWQPRGGRTVEMSTRAPKACTGDSVETPVRTRYTFFDAGAAENTIRVERRWSFSAATPAYVSAPALRAYVPRLNYGTYNQEIFPNAAGTALVTEGICNVCNHSADWNKTWVAINSSATNAGLLILRAPGQSSAASVTLDYDSSSGANNTGISLDRPPAGWHEELTETEYLCFYDATSWPVGERLTRLPDGCAATTAPINTSPPAISAGAGHPRAGERFFAGAGTWENATNAYLYRWSRCLEDVCEQIPGATTTEYVATAADVGKSLKLTVTATGLNGETDSAESNIAGTISGHVYEGSKKDGPLVAGARVQVCRRSGSPCRSTTTAADGSYRVQAPLVGKFRVTAFPPAGSNAVAHTRATITRVKAEADKGGQDVVLGAIELPPPEVSFSGSGVRGKEAGGVPVVHWQEPFVIDYETDLDNEVEARVEFGDGQQLRVPPNTPVEASPLDPEKGIFKFSIQPLFPNHGAARVTILVRGQRSEAQIEAEQEEAEAEEEEESEEEEAEEEEEDENEEEDEEPEEDEESEEEEDEEEDNEDEEEEQEEDEEEEETGPGDPEETTFPIYIDPSGFVRTVSGAPLGGATVTLFQSESKTGPFAVVPDGSAVMSPMNRKNPDQSEADGHFGWDVIAGFYKVKVEKSGCHAPGPAGQPFVETTVMTIPPPVTDLDLRLECVTLVGDPGPPPASRPEPSSLRAGLSLPRSAGTVKVGKAGQFQVKAATIACPAASPGACSVDFAITAPAPTKKGKPARKSRAKAALKLGSGTLAVAAGKTASLEGKLAASGLRQLKKLGNLRATIAVTARVPSGETSLGSLGVTLVPPPKPKPRASR